jgi:hypothetical protein
MVRPAVRALSRRLPLDWRLSAGGRPQSFHLDFTFQ